MKRWMMVLVTVWFLWGQDEKFWSYRVLNVIPGPTRGNPYILGEFESQDACMKAYFKQSKAQSDMWELPVMKEDIKKFGGLRAATSYACVPTPFKPERIDLGGSWR
jgi:hypothetical protein